MRILIATGIYPPQIGGPAQYAFNLSREFSLLGHKVRVAKFSDVRKWPSGFRHFLFFLKLLPEIRRSDWCLALDTFSAALPAVLAAKLFGKKITIRVGGDFLWENYVERTGDLVLLRKFYQTTGDRWTQRERLIFWLTGWLLRQAWRVVFSTDWQRQIWREPYQLNFSHTVIIENYYGQKETVCLPTKKNFIGSVRRLRWKNLETLRRAFTKARNHDSDLTLDLSNLEYKNFLEKIKNCYSVILVSLGDISPNLILDALRFNKPFILTRETGLYEKLKDVGLFVDPEDENDITEKILWLSRDKNYQKVQEKIVQFGFSHSWREIAEEFLSL